MITLLRVIEGLALLIFGRQLFWLFVAAIGFEVGTLVATRLLPPQSEIIVIIIALIVGLIGALLALSLQSFIIGAVGFIAGGLVGVSIMNLFVTNSDVLTVAAFIVGGLIGAGLFAYLFDWALMALSSLVGAITLTNVFLPSGGTLALVAIIILFIIGMAIQSGWIWQQRRRTV